MYPTLGHQRVYWNNVAHPQPGTLQGQTNGARGVGWGEGGHSWWMCVFVVVRLFDKEEKTQQSEAPGLHRGSGDIKG